MNQTTMKALVMKGIGKLEFTDKLVPVAGPFDVVVRTTRALVCSSDVDSLNGGIGDRSDLTLGQNAVGRVHDVGSEVAGINLGDRVVVSDVTPCRRCGAWRQGDTSRCPRIFGRRGNHGSIEDGVFAQYFLVNQACVNLAPIPESVSDDLAVYVCDILSTGFAATEQAAIPLWGSVAVFGFDPVGMMAIAGAQCQGAGSILAVGRGARRRAMARWFGADVVIDCTRVDPVAEILQLTGGQGVDSAIECAGGQELFEACVKVTRPGGTISVVDRFMEIGSLKNPRVSSVIETGDRTIRIGRCPAGSARMKRLLGLIERGQMNPSPMTTHVFEFNDIEKAFHLMATGRDGIIEPLIVFEN